MNEIKITIHITYKGDIIIDIINKLECATGYLKIRHWRLFKRGTEKLYLPRISIWLMILLMNLCRNTRPV